MEYCACGHWRDFYFKRNAKEEVLSYIFIDDNKMVKAACSTLTNINIQNKTNFHYYFSTPYKVVLMDSNSNNFTDYVNLVSSFYETEELFAVIIFNVEMHNDPLCSKIHEYNLSTFKNKNIIIYEIGKEEVEHNSLLKCLIYEIFISILRNTIINFKGRKNYNFDISEYIKSDMERQISDINWNDIL